MKSKIVLDLQIECNNLTNIPQKFIFLRWINCIFFSFRKKIELTIRIVDETESRALNMYFLNNNVPTNVLSFPFEAPPQINTFLIGDLVICQNIIEYEAKIKNVSVEVQMAHTVIHGSLHLMGYRHTTHFENEIMKNLENKIIKKLGYT